MTPVFGIKHRASGQWLHIRRFDSDGKVLLTADVREGWCSFKEQAVSQASFLESPEDYLVVELPASTKTVGIRHKPTGQWLHIRVADSDNKAMVTDQPSNAWVSFEHRAETMLSKFLNRDDWEIAEMPGFDLDAMLQFSGCNLSSRVAIERLGRDYYGDLLSLLGSFGLPYPALPDDVLKRQVDGFIAIMADSDGYSRDRHATIRREAGIYTADIEDQGNLIATASDANPLLLARKLLDHGVYVGYVTCKIEPEFCAELKKEMRRLMKEAS